MVKDMESGGQADEGSMGGRGGAGEDGGSSGKRRVSQYPYLSLDTSMSNPTTPQFSDTSGMQTTWGGLSKGGLGSPTQAAGKPAVGGGGMRRESVSKNSRSPTRGIDHGENSPGGESSVAVGGDLSGSRVVRGLLEEENEQEGGLLRAAWDQSQGLGIRRLELKNETSEDVLLQPVANIGIHVSSEPLSQRAVAKLLAESVEKCRELANTLPDGVAGSPSKKVPPFHPSTPPLLHIPIFQHCLSVCLSTTLKGCNTFIARYHIHSTLSQAPNLDSHSGKWPEP